MQQKNTQKTINYAFLLILSLMLGLSSTQLKASTAAPRRGYTSSDVKRIADEKDLLLTGYIHLYSDSTIPESVQEIMRRYYIFQFDIIQMTSVKNDPTKDIHAIVIQEPGRPTGPKNALIFHRYVAFMSKKGYTGKNNYLLQGYYLRIPGGVPLSFQYLQAVRDSSQQSREQDTENYTLVSAPNNRLKSDLSEQQEEHMIIVYTKDEQEEMKNFGSFVYNRLSNKTPLKRIYATNYEKKECKYASESEQQLYQQAFSIGSVIEFDDHGKANNLKEISLEVAMNSEEPDLWNIEILQSTRVKCEYVNIYVLLLGNKKILNGDKYFGFLEESHLDSWYENEYRIQACRIGPICNEWPDHKKSIRFLDIVGQRPNSYGPFVMSVAFCFGQEGSMWPEKESCELLFYPEQASPLKIRSSIKRPGITIPIWLEKDDINRQLLASNNEKTLDPDAIFWVVGGLIVLMTFMGLLNYHIERRCKPNSSTM